MEYQQLQQEEELKAQRRQQEQLAVVAAEVAAVHSAASLAAFAGQMADVPLLPLRLQLPVQFHATCPARWAEWAALL